MRQTSEYSDYDNPNAKFPYDLASLMCYLFISPSGETFQLPNDISFKDAYDKAVTNKGKILVIWPGKWRTDAFEVDDLHEFGLAKGCIQEDLPIKILGYRISPFNSPRGATDMNVFIEFTCPKDEIDAIRYLPNFSERMFSMLHNHFGWNIATSKGSSANGYGKNWTFTCSVKSTEPNYHLLHSWGENPEKRWLEESITEATT